MEESYLQYAELLLDGTVQLLIPQAEDMILASVTLYNDALSDIPVVMDYRITVNTVVDHLAIAETYIDLINNEIKVGIFYLKNLKKNGLKKMWMSDLFLKQKATKN